MTLEVVAEIIQAVVGAFSGTTLQSPESELEQKGNLGLLIVMAVFVIAAILIFHFF